MGPGNGAFDSVPMLPPVSAWFVQSKGRAVQDGDTVTSWRMGQDWEQGLDRATGLEQERQGILRARTRGLVLGQGG